MIFKGLAWTASERVAPPLRGGGHPGPQRGLATAVELLASQGQATGITRMSAAIVATAMR